MELDPRASLQNRVFKRFPPEADVTGRDDLMLMETMILFKDGQIVRDDITVLQNVPCGKEIMGQATAVTKLI